MSTVGTRWYTIAEAAPILGVSVDTVRRRVKRGQLEARQVRTQHGPTWEICLGNLQAKPAPAAEGTEGSAQGAAYGVAEGLEDRSQALAAWAASLIAPLAAELGQARETIVGQAGEIADLRERVGALTEQVDGRERELVRYSADIAALSGQLAESEVSRRRDTRRLSIALAVAGALAVAAGTAPAWVR